MKRVILLNLFLFLAINVGAQTINWGPTSPAVTSESITTCYQEGSMTFTFTNVGMWMTDATIEIQLDTGINYVEGSISYTSTGSGSIGEDDIDDPRRPIFYVGGISIGEQFTVTIDRIATCEARDQKIAGSAFIDTVHVYEAGTEVSYSNGIANGTVVYDVLYGSLSVTSVATTPSVNNLGGTSTRTMTFTNGSFGVIQEFYFADIYNPGDITLSNFRINPSGVNYAIPAGNIKTNGDSIIIDFYGTQFNSVDGSGGTVGDGDNIFEKDETFILSYDVTPNVCIPSNTIPSKLVAWFGCSYGEPCQLVENASSIGLTNAAPTITLSESLKPRLDFCDTVIYSVKLTNSTTETSPSGGAYAKDVTALLGFRYNNDPISTLANNFQWGSGRYNTKFFTSHELNGVPVTLPTVAGKYSTTLPYLPPDYFTTDPDGPGGLTDVDGDGFYDDLPKDSTLVISYGVYIIPRDTDCDFGRFDYLGWEHIAADISWENQCDVLMSPIRQEFNYTNHIRDYLNSTFIDAPTDVVDGENFSAGIMPHLYTTINCNGGNGYSGTDVNWITQIVLPPGLSLQSGYDATVYILSNDTVTVTDKYSYTWTNFPLQFNCADWDGTNPLAFTISTFYECGDGTDVCYREEMHCYDFSVVVPHCPTACTGILPLNFSAERVSESWTDNTQTALVDLDDPTIVKDFVFPYDTVEFKAAGVFTDTMTENLYFRVNYSPENGGNIFLFEEGTIEIVDIDGQYNSGQTNYIIPLAGSPTVNNLGGNNYEMIFDLSSYRTTVDASYQYGQNSGGPPTYDGDSIKISARMVISNTMAIQVPYTVNDFRADFYVLDQDKNEIECDDWGATINYLRPSFSAGNNEIAQSGCQSIEKPFYITYRSFTDDDHPNEYRPPFQIDSAVMQIPVGWEVGDVKWLDGAVMAASDYDFRADRSLILRRPSAYKDYDKQNTFYPRFYVELIANCAAPAGKTEVPYTCYLKDYAYLTDVSSHVSKTSTDNVGPITYTPPTMTVTPINQTVTAYEENIAWEVRVCNATSNMDVSNNWLLLSDEDNQITIDSVVDITGGGATLLTTNLTPDGDVYAQVGALNQGVCADLLIYSSFSSCERDTLDAIHGWACTGYPAAADVVACGATTELYILPQTAQISASISDLTDTPIDPSNPAAGNWGSSSIDMCSEFPAEITIVNSQPAYLYDVNLGITIPSFGNGLAYVSGSATIEVEGIDAVNTPRAIGAAAEAALILASTNGDPSWSITLAELDPTNYGSGEAFSGTLNSANNQFILRWELESTCDLSSGDNFFVSITGNDPCGSPAEGSGDQNKGFDLNIIGAEAPYFSFITINADPDTDFDGCSDTKTIDLALLLAGGSTGTTDTLSVVLPYGLGYGGGYVCNTTGKCPTYVGSSIVAGNEVLSFKYPNGITGNIDFSFDLTTDARGGCSPSSVVQFLSKKTIPGLACGSGFCTASQIITGNEDLTISMEKPILTVDFASLVCNTTNSPYTYSYEFDLENTGIDTEDDIVVEFYCLNPAGTDITGSVVARDTLKSILTNGSTSTLMGEFFSTCDPDQGMAVLIVPEHDNCYCSSLESMADKSAGLSEIPYDSMTMINAINLFTDIDNDDDGIPDADERRICDLGTWVNIAAWDMNNFEGNASSSSDTDAIARDQKIGSGWDSWNIPAYPGAALELNSSSFPQSLNEAITKDFYLEYTVLPGSGKALEVRYIAWGWNDYTNTPKHDFKVSIYSQTDSYVNPIVQDISRPNDTDNYIWEDHSINCPYFNDVLDSIVLRIYIYEPTVGTGGSAITSGTIVWDDFFLGGYHAPLDDCDGDGVPNIFDLDSDNDGIYDAIEAGHGEALTNGQVTGTMGFNGLDDALETVADNAILNFTIDDSDSDGNFDMVELDSDNDVCFDTNEEAISDDDINGLAGVGIPVVDANGLVTSITYASTMTNNYWQDVDLLSLFCDSDQDSVHYSVDLDDDNDGILDDDEKSCIGFRPVDLSGITTSGSGNTTLTDEAILASVSNAMTFDGDITANHTSTYSSRPQGRVDGDLRFGNNINTEVSEYEIIFESPTDIRLSQAELSGIFDQSETWTVTTYGGTIAVNNPVVNVTTHNSTNWNDTELNNVSGEGTNEVSFNPKLSGGDGNISVADSEWNLTAYDVTRLTIKVNMTTVGANVTKLKLSVDCIPIDTDGDGTPDHLDVDSDGDGCVDAIEGAGNYNPTNLNVGNALAGGVDANGIPIIALGGQATASDVTNPFDETQCPCVEVRTNRHVRFTKILRE